MHRVKYFFFSLVFGAIATAMAIPAAKEWWRTDAALNLRIAIVRLGGYDGCTCYDCADVYGFGPTPRQPFIVYRTRCMTCERGLRPPILPKAIVASGTAIFSLILVRRGLKAPARFESGCCQRCGYELSGLRRPVCPECGAASAE